MGPKASTRTRACAMLLSPVTTFLLLVLVAPSATGDEASEGAEQSLAWLQSACEQGGGWRRRDESSMHSQSRWSSGDLFTRITPATFFRAAA